MEKNCLAYGANRIANAAFIIVLVFCAPLSAQAQVTLVEQLRGTSSDGPISGAPLSLAEAVQIALLAEDPSVQGFDERAAALQDRAVAEAQLPDPMARLAVANLPLDSFDFAQEPMTQLQLGLRQEFPSGNTLGLNGVRRQAQAEEQLARKRLALRRIELAVSTAWFDRFYFEQAKGVVAESHSAVLELLQALGASFATGNLTSQDILRTELELSLLDDSLIEIERSSATAQADLARYIGAAANRPLPDMLPDLRDPPSFGEIEAALASHPELVGHDAMIAVEEADVQLAEEAYKPSWALEAGYGLRGGRRADFATLGVSVSIPLVPGRRQDRYLDAAVKERGAARLDRGATLLDLHRDLERAYADWTHLNERVELYRDATLARATETAEASITTYANRLTDFSELIRSQLAELDTELKYLELRTAQAKAWAVLNYLAGDTL
jgi:outer membrane protein TolC